MKFILVILTLLLTSCSDEGWLDGLNDILGSNIDTRFVDIYLEDPIDENGYYHLEDYSNYHRVSFYSEPLGRVKWGTDSYFIIEDHLGNTYEEPVIQYSTYADDWGNGEQLFGLYDVEPGDTLMIYGYINEVIYDYLYFIID